MPLNLKNLILFGLNIILCITVASLTYNFLCSVLYLAWFNNFVYITNDSGSVFQLYIKAGDSQGGESQGEGSQGGGSQGGGGNGPNQPNKTDHLHKPTSDSSDSDSENKSNFYIDVTYANKREHFYKLYNYYIKGLKKNKIKLSMSENPNFVKDYNKFSDKFKYINRKINAFSRRTYSYGDDVYRKEQMSINKSIKNLLNSLPSKYKPKNASEYKKYAKFFRKD